MGRERWGHGLEPVRGVGRKREWVPNRSERGVTAAPATAPALAPRAPASSSRQLGVRVVVSLGGIIGQVFDEFPFNTIPIKEVPPHPVPMRLTDRALLITGLG